MRRSSECASTVLPAPVSPVIAFRPDPRRSSARSIRRRFSIRSSSSIAKEIAAEPDGFVRRLVLGAAGQAAELLADAAVEVGSGELREPADVGAEPDLDLVARREVADMLAVDHQVDGL